MPQLSLEAINHGAQRLRREAAVLLSCAAAATGIAAMAESAVADPGTNPAPIQQLGLEPYTTPAQMNSEVTNFLVSPAIITKAHKSVYKDSRVPISVTPKGFVSGTATNGNTVAIEMSSTSGKFVFGLIGKRVCGWVEAAVVDNPAVNTTDGPCKKYVNKMKYWRPIGKGFNCDKQNRCDDGTIATPLTPECDRKIFGNYIPDAPGFDNPIFPDTSTGFINPDGKVPKGTLVHYRYTKRDGNAIWVRIDGVGWRAMARACVDGYPTGGHRLIKKSKSVAT